LPSTYLSIIQENGRRFASRDAYRVFRDGRWQGVSWTGFWERIGKVACALLHHGVAEQELIVLYAPNSPEWTEADLGCLAVRAVTVPIHTTSSREAVRQILAETSPRVAFVGNPELAAMLLAHAPQTPTVVLLEGDHPGCITLERFLDCPARLDWDERMKHATPEDLWTIVYTSGTTGEVRGAMLTQQSILFQIESHRSRLPDLDHRDSSFCLLPLSHIFERGWTFIQYAWGMTQHYCKVDPQAIHLLRNARPSILCLVPRILEKIYLVVHETFNSKPAPIRNLIQRLVALALEVSRGRREGREPSAWQKVQLALADALLFSKVRALFGGRLKHCVVGSAALSTKVHEFFNAAGIFINCGYGLTETTATLSSTPLGSSTPGSVGLALEGLEIRLGEESEIQVQGPTVMQGYYLKPEATAEVFTPDGFFKTGDVGRFDSRGFLHITDRLKDLIRTSTGKFVAPQYLEARLASCPLIEQAAVVGEGRSWLGALLVPDFSRLEEYARQIGLAHHSREDLVGRPEIIAFVKQTLDELLRDVARHERVQRIVLLAQPFTIQAGELTPTLKLRRKIIAERYREAIARMDDWCHEIQLTSEPRAANVRP
jgi:long-chain acyl-CoA synthetase